MRRKSAALCFSLALMLSMSACQCQPSSYFFFSSSSSSFSSLYSPVPPFTSIFPTCHQYIVFITFAPMRTQSEELSKYLWSSVPDVRGIFRVPSMSGNWDMVWNFVFDYLRPGIYCGRVWGRVKIWKSWLEHCMSARWSIISREITKNTANVYNFQYC